MGERTMMDYEPMRTMFYRKCVELEPWDDHEYLDLFRFQSTYNPVYRSYCDYLNVNVDNVSRLEDIPFLPVSVFKNHIVKTGNWMEERVFRSSGTTGQSPSCHFVRDLKFYHRCAVNSFSCFYGNPGEYVWFGLLPSYLERADSSLVEMVRYFMSLGAQKNGFYLDQMEQLTNDLIKAGASSQKIVVIGVSFALLDWAESKSLGLPDQMILMETGGMKGRKAELTREALHEKLKTSFGLDRIHSEYGMTEMMHQCYARENGHFLCPTPVKILRRELHDPLTVHRTPGPGVLNLIDPGNVDTCAFIAVEDLVQIRSDGKFELLGRTDDSELRGCNLMYTGTENQFSEQ